MRVIRDFSKHVSTRRELPVTDSLLVFLDELHVFLFLVDHVESLVELGE